MKCPRCFKIIGDTALCPYCCFSFEEEEPRRVKANALPLFYQLNDQYELGELLGAGGFGITYRSRDLKTNETVAIKEFFPATLCVRESMCNVAPVRNADEFEASVNHFFEEARTLYRLNNCPSVARIKAFFRKNNTAYIVMDFIKGESISKKCDPLTKRLDYQTAKNYTLQVALALSEVHALGIVHRDISPANVLVTPSGEIKLIDFGAARSFMEENDPTLTVQFKPGYAPPEQYAGSSLPVGPWTDIYALAAMFFRMVTGQVPPPAPERKKKEKLPELTQYVPEAEERVISCLNQAMELDCGSRYQNINAFIAAFTDYNEAPTDPGTAPTDPRAKLRQTVSGLISRFGKKVGSEKGCVAVAKIIVGLQPGSELEIMPGKQYLFGRQTDMCNMVVSDKTTVSRVHFRVSALKDGRYISITDYSSNGLSINYGPKLKGETVNISNDCILILSDGDAIVSIIWKPGQEGDK